MLVIYFLSTVGGFYASALWSPAVSVGASAGLFGLIGAMIALGVRHRNAMGAAIRGMYMRGAIIGLVFGMVAGVPRRQRGAHRRPGGGLRDRLPGRHSRTAGRRSRTLWRVAGWFCILMTVVSFLKMYLWFAASTQ